MRSALLCDVLGFAIGDHTQKFVRPPEKVYSVQQKVRFADIGRRAAPLSPKALEQNKKPARPHLVFVYLWDSE